MKARQNSLSKAVSKFEALLERLFQAPFGRIFPSPIQPIEITQKLKRAMEDGAVMLNDGRFIIPNTYDIYVSTQDYQSFLLPNQNKLIRDWQEQFVEYARHRQYVHSGIPVLRLHEDSTLKLGQGTIKPAEDIEIAQKLKRAMEDGAVRRSDGRFLVPNAYDIYVSTQDYQSFSPNQSDLIQDWQGQLVEYARQRQHILSDTPVLRLHAGTALKQGQATVKPAEESEVRMATQALDAQQLAELRKLYPQGIPGADAAAPPVNPMGAAPVAQRGHQGRAANMPPVMPEPQAHYEMPLAQLTIRLPQGGQRTYRIEKVVISLGRQLDNDIIVEDKRVGRYHAQIKFDGKQFILYDLGSTNGTLVNQGPITQPHILRTGDVFTVGSYDFHFERR